MVPAPKRTAVTLSAVLVVAIAGAYWLWSGTRAKHVTPPDSPNTAMTDTADTANSATPASTTTTTSTTTPAANSGSTTTTATPVPDVYTVLPNDTLESIALKFYNDKKYWTEIEALNEDTLQYRPDSLMAGTKLNMPKLEDLKPAAAASSTSNQSGSTSAPANGNTTTPAQPSHVDNTENPLPATGN